MKKALICSLILLSAGTAKAALLSAYTSVSKESCVMYSSSNFDSGAESDERMEECAGLGGYQVMISGADSRYPLYLVYQGKEIQLTRFHFLHEVASSKIEWLYERTANGNVIYKALIHRINAQRDDDGSEDLLIVTKLDGQKTCSVAVVKSAMNMNQIARQIGEKAANLKCLDL